MNSYNSHQDELPEIEYNDDGTIKRINKKKNRNPWGLPKEVVGLTKPFDPWAWDLKQKDCSKIE